MLSPSKSNIGIDAMLEILGIRHVAAVGSWRKVVKHARKGDNGELCRSTYSTRNLLLCWPVALFRILEFLRKKTQTEARFVLYLGAYR